MIKTIKHKGLRQFYETGTRRGINAQWASRLRDILVLLDAAAYPEDMNLPGLKFHPLRGNYDGFYSVSVNGNWRVIFQFEGNDVILVDLVDYH